MAWFYFALPLSMCIRFQICVCVLNHRCVWHTIQVGIKQEAYQLADRLTEGPVVLVGIVEDEEGKSEDIECVTHRQVEHVNGGRLPSLCTEHHHKKSCGVQRQTNDKNQGVADGKENEFKVFIKSTERAGVGAVGHVDVRVGHADCDSTWGEDLDWLV